MMSRKYEREFKRKIVRLHPEEGGTRKSICEEYGVSKSAVTRWCEEYSRECKMISQNDPTAVNKADFMKENLPLRKELEEAKIVYELHIPVLGRRHDGAKEMLLVDDVENKEFLHKLLEAMYEELPAPRKRGK